MFFYNTCTRVLNWTITKLDTLERRNLLSHSCAGNPRLRSALVLRKVEEQLLYAIYLKHERSHTRNVRGYPRRSVNLVKSEQSGLPDCKLTDLTISPSCQPKGCLWSDDAEGESRNRNGRFRHCTAAVARKGNFWHQITRRMEANMLPIWNFRSLTSPFPSTVCYPADDDSILHLRKQFGKRTEQKTFPPTRTHKTDHATAFMQGSCLVCNFTHSKGKGKGHPRTKAQRGSRGIALIFP